MLNLQIIIGSTRPGRAADRIVPWISQAAREHGEFDVDVLDLRDWQLPIFGETFATLGDPANPTFTEPEVRRWNNAIMAGDAYLFITPEYNHSVPAVLKNAIDSAFATFAFRNKPAAFLAYSGGIGGGIRAVEHLGAHIAIEAEPAGRFTRATAWSSSASRIDRSRYSTCSTDGQPGSAPGVR